MPTLDAVIGGAANAIFFNSGQVCCAGSRLYAHRKIFDQVVEGVSGAASAIRLGPGLDQTTQMGPLVSKEQQDRVLALHRVRPQAGRDRSPSAARRPRTPATS